MFQRIIVPLDGSTGAERAIPVVARLARASGGSIVFVHAVLPPVDFGKYARQHAVLQERGVALPVPRVAHSLRVLVAEEKQSCFPLEWPVRPFWKTARIVIQWSKGQAGVIP